MAFLNIVVDDAHIPKIDQLAAKLNAMGLKVSNIGRTLGFIDGETDLDPSVFEKVEGVRMVAPERKFFAAGSVAPPVHTTGGASQNQQFRRVEGA